MATEQGRRETSKFRPQPCPTCGSERAVVDGHWLRRQRQRAGLTLREVSRRLGFSAPYISDVELNRRNCTPAIRAFYERL